MGCCDRCGLGWLPIALLVLCLVTFFTSYAIGVAKGHISANFPYISDTGAEPPESCLFSFGLSVCAFITFVVGFVRYKQVAEYNKQDIQRVLRLNRYAFFAVIVSSFGMLVVASFQEFGVGIVHLIGALMVFLVGCIYCWIQTAMTWRMKRNSESRLLDVRFTISLLVTACLVATFLFMAFAKHDFSAPFENKDHNETLHWKSTFGGYKSHIASTASEWTMTILFLIFFLTFLKDFRHISLDVQIRLRLLEDFSFDGTAGNVNRLPLDDDDGSIW